MKRHEIHIRAKRKRRDRILKTIRDSGPRKASVIAAWAGGDETMLGWLVSCEKLVKIGDKRGAVWGTPEQAARATKACRG
jgi:hypothetical protein